MKKDSYTYTIIFTFVLTVVFATMLAITQAYFLPTITENEANVERAAIFKVLDLPKGENLVEAFGEQVIPTSVADLTVYAVHDDDDKVQSYAFPLNGQGLWGSISGYLGVNADFDRILGLEFTDQSETPGLGGRIDEDWYKDQFRDVPIVAGEKIVYGDGLDAITGATSSSNAVLNILNDTISELMIYREVLVN